MCSVIVLIQDTRGDQRTAKSNNHQNYLADFRMGDFKWTDNVDGH